MLLPHSFTSRTCRCRCRPGRLANTWPPAREPPACQDSLKVCVSNPAGPAGQDRRWLGRLQAGPCADWSKDLGPLPNSESAGTSRRASIFLGMLSVCGKTADCWGSQEHRYRGDSSPSGWFLGSPIQKRTVCFVREQSEPHTLGLRYECGSLVVSLRGPVLQRERPEWDPQTTGPGPLSTETSLLMILLVPSGPGQSLGNPAC